MKGIAIFYHALLSGPTISSDFALHLFADQMMTLRETGLADALKHMFIGCNGPREDLIPLANYAPSKAETVSWVDGHSEIPTMKVLREWCRREPGYNVLYFHMKGVSHGPTDPYKRWRGCMENVCLWQWQKCVSALDQGYESAGAHWCTPKLNYMVTIPMWGGNFFWSTSEFLATLPEFHEDSHKNRFEAESWIGLGKKLPKVRDFAPHWPMQGCV